MEEVMALRAFLMITETNWLIAAMTGQQAQWLQSLAPSIVPKSSIDVMGLWRV